MLTLLAIVHIIIGLGLVLFVLLQDPKGGAMGVFSGGSSSSSFFGTSGASNFLTATTKWLAILFAVSCLTLTYVTSKRGTSVMDTYTPPAGSAPAAPAAETKEGATPADPAAAPAEPAAGEADKK
ncbi:MAG: preprotein translocase subunit SecG [Bdellovibrionales bacterium]